MTIRSRCLPSFIISVTKKNQLELGIGRKSDETRSEELADKTSPHHARYIG